MFRLSPHPIRLRARDLLWPIWLAPGWIALWIAMSLPVDGQTLTQGGQTADSRRQLPLGMGVFGPVLGIHGHDSLMVAGDLVLDQANVVGTGTLVLKSRQPRRLQSTTSTLTNLAIDNPTQVTLTGDLRLTGHLTIKEGTFITDSGTLTLTPACQTQLLAGGRLKTGPIVRPAIPAARPLLNFSHSGLLQLTPSLPAPAIRATRWGAPAVQAEDRYASLAHEKLAPPPELTVQ